MSDAPAGAGGLHNGITERSRGPLPLCRRRRFRGNAGTWGIDVSEADFLDLLQQFLERTTRDYTPKLRLKISDDAHVVNGHVTNPPFPLHV
jgi:hypothetical protein